MKSPLAISLQVILRSLYLCLPLLLLSIKWLPNAWSHQEKSLDAPLHYTVKVMSKQYGNVSETRAIASGEVDDFTWNRQPPISSGPVDARCPRIESLPLDANHTMLRQIKVRLAPVVNLNKMASIQMSFSAHTPQGSYLHKLNNGREINCPIDRAHQEIKRFDIPLNGKPRKIVLADGTNILVSVKH